MANLKRNVAKCSSAYQTRSLCHIYSKFREYNILLYIVNNLVDPKLTAMVITKLDSPLTLLRSWPQFRTSVTEAMLNPPWQQQALQPGQPK